MKKRLFFSALSAAVVLTAGYCGYRHVVNSSDSDLFLANVEALSRSEISYGYDKHTYPCPRPNEYKKQVVCVKYGKDPNCMPSDC